MRHIAIFVPESAWAGSVTLTLEMLETAIAFQERKHQKRSMSVDLIGLTNKPVPTYSGVLITPKLSVLQASTQYDAIVIPAIWDIDSQYLKRHKILYPWLRQQQEGGAIFVGALTGTYLMAEAGLLDGIRATTHWHYANDFRQRYPKVDLKAEMMQTSDKGCYCCGGVNASLDLSIYLIQLFCSQSIAQLCERHCLMGTRRDYQRLTVDTIERKQHQDTRILDIQNWVEIHYAEPIGIHELTARFGFSTRNLSRRFKAATGVSLQTYIQEYRLEIAKALLEDLSLSIQQVCFKVGYESLTVFGRRFKSYTGCSATDYRNRMTSGSI